MPLQEVHTGFTFAFDGSKFSAIQRGVKRASTSLNTIAAKTEIFTQKIGRSFARIGQLVGAYVGFRAVRLLTTDYAKSADAVGKFSKATGVSTDFLQKFYHAMEIGGATTEDSEKGIKRFVKVVNDVGRGLKTAKDAFRDIGLDPATVTSDEAGLLRVSEALSNMEDKGKRAAAAQDIFGRAALKLIPGLEVGREKLKEYMDEAVKLGKVMSVDQIKAGEKFTDEMLRVKAVLTGIRNTIASKLLPSLSNMLEKFRTWWVEGRNAERAMRTLKLVAIFTGIVIARLIGASVIKNITLFVKGIWAGVQALRAMGTAGAIAAIKVWAIIAAFVIVAAIIHDLVRFAQGKDSAIGRLLGDSKLAKDLKDALVGVGKAALKAWKDLKPALLEAWKALKPALRELGKAMEPLAGPAFRAGVWLLVGSLKALAAWIEIAAFSVNTFSAVATAVFGAVSWAVNKIIVAWEDFTDSFGADFTKAADVVSGIAKALGIDLGAAAAAAGKIWKAAFGGIISTIDFVISGARTALGLMHLLAGGEVEGLAAGEKAALREGDKAPGLTSTGGHVLPGLFRPTPRNIFNMPDLPRRIAPIGIGAGTDFAGNKITTNVGTVAVTVNNTSGDPEVIAKVVTDTITKQFNDVITAASRDLVKAPQGQR